VGQQSPSGQSELRLKNVVVGEGPAPEERTIGRQGADRAGPGHPDCATDSGRSGTLLDEQASPSEQPRQPPSERQFSR